MDEIKEMLKAVVNGQHSLRTELLGRISDLENKFERKFEALENKMDDGFAEVNKRLDKQGAQLAYLEEDAPTREEDDALEKRVKKLEHYSS